MSELPEESSVNGQLSLKIPGDAQYIGIARLAVSGLANQLDIPYDEAEDLKLAVTEACSHILRSAKVRLGLEIACQYSDDLLEIKVKSTPETSTPASADALPIDYSTVSGNGDPELGIYLLEALMDTVEMETDEATGATVVHMARRLQTVA